MIPISWIQFLYGPSSLTDTPSAFNMPDTLTKIPSQTRMPSASPGVSCHPTPDPHHIPLPYITLEHSLAREIRVRNCDSGERQVKLCGFMVHACPIGVRWLIRKTQCGVHAHYNITLGKHVTIFPEKHLAKHISVLTDLLHNVLSVFFWQMYFLGRYVISYAVVCISNC